jgi:hypothetical protein
VHPPQLLLYLLELCPHAVASGFPLKEEIAPTGFAANELEAQEMSDPTFLGICVLGIYVVSDASFAPRAAGGRY